MKKVLSILLLSSSLFSMELAYKLHNPLNRFNRITSAIVKKHKEKTSSIVSIVSHVVDTPKVHIDSSSIRAPHALSDAKLYHGKKD